ncbi:hypothetical protein A2318_01335 [Candidatus Uhrbacteria bacterium RIFOXYB2_FULL_45_11]|uniref:Uncharacterized protein n=1 Tax=Candidatus Uhrbacteria bacterium RIFOXYB2_FULL_45_11 TaxID=1802421 RepID=A0A1F7W5Z2_9BACT|nr:MAG: hypothetical protein A2318_01335 [Candidatus Uhrbacteria bacterium RIFOXYB2_FULL_45_11]
MALQAVAQGAVKMGQGAAKLTQGVAKAGGQMIKSAGSTTSQETRSIAERKSVFAQNRIPGMNRESNIDQIMRTGSSQTPRAPMQSPLQRQSTLRTNQLQAQNPLRQPAQAARAQENEDEDQEEEEQEEQRRVSFQSFMQLVRIKGALIDAADLPQNDNARAQQADATRAAQDAAKQAAKKMVPKAANAGANFISTALDLGTGGAGLVVTIFIHLLSLGWLNVEMVYGTWLKKGKDPVIGRLSWDPIPMPIDKNGIILQGMVIMADLIVITIVVILFAVQVLMLLLMASPALLVGFGISKLF